MATAPKVSGSVAETSIEQARHQPREQKREDDANAQAKQGKLRSLSQNQTQNVAPLRPEGHANSDFMRALRGRVRNHAENSDRGEHESNRAERTQKERAKSFPRDRLAERVREGFDIRHGQVLVNGVNRLANGGGHARYAQRTSYDDLPSIKRRLSEGHVHHRAGFLG